MTDQTADPFDDTAVNSRDREVGMNVVLNFYKGYNSDQLEAVTVEDLIDGADKVAKFLHNGTLPDKSEV